MTIIADRPQGYQVPEVNAPVITETTAVAGASTVLPRDSINPPATNAAEGARSSAQEQDVDLGVDEIGGQNDEGGSVVVSDVDYDPDALREEILQTSLIMSHSPRKQAAIARLFEKGKAAVRNALGRRSPSPQGKSPSGNASPRALNSPPRAPSVGPYWSPRGSPAPQRSPSPLRQRVPLPSVVAAAPVPKKPLMVTLSRKPRPDDYYDNFGLRPSPRLLLVLLNNAHLPLTACTNEAIRHINMNSSKYKSAKWTDGEGQLRQLVDLSQVKPEVSLTPDLWREAWRNLFTVMELKVDGVGIADDIRKMHRQHYDWLCAQRDFDEVFTSILEFDVDQRNQFWTSAEKYDIGVGEYAYRDSYRQVCDSNIRRALSLVHRSSYRDSLSSGGRGSSSGYHPYRDDRSFWSDGQTGGGQGSGSGQGSRSSDSNRAQAICLICATIGHAARSCSRTNLPNGHAAYCAWDHHEERLVAAGSKRPICIMWNIRSNNANQSCGANCGDHTCAFCGSSDHRASSRRCL